MPESELVRFENEGGIGVITVDNPPVNALSPGVPQGITAAIDKGNADPAVKAMVLIGAGRSFIAGADIRQFGRGPATPPPTRRHYDVSDQSPKPIVAAIHGYALGGGLETALACHYRVAVPSAKVGLPEVQIGILPGAGGTQRLPRLTGPKVALEMITSGRHVPAAEAHKLGIIDEIIPEGQLKEAAIAFARKIADKRPLPVIRERDDKLAGAKSDPVMFDNFRKSIARRARNQRAPYACIEAVEAAVKLPFDEGIAVERRLFEEQVNSEEAKALRYAFFAEREAQKLPDLARDIQLRPTDTAAVVGAGTMGGGIAMSFADYGYSVKITDSTKEALDRGMQRIRANYETSVKRGSLSAEEMEQRLARIEPVTDYDALGECDLVIEAVFEQIPVKQEVWKKIDAAMKAGALLFSNTSGINIDIMANETKRPEDVAGTHFFAPANVMKLFEVVKGTKSATDVLATAMALGQKTGKGWYRYEPGDRTPHPDPEVARIIKETVAELSIAQHDFTDEEILKRLLFASVNEACKILDEGKALRASDVDVMWLYGFGFPRYRGGLMFWADTIGVREVYNQIAAWHQRYGERWAPSPLLRRLAESGAPLREAKTDRLR